MQEVLTYPGVVYLWNKISQKFDEKNTSLTVDSAPTSATVSYVDALGNTKNHIVGDKRVVPNNARPSGQDIYILVSITQGVASWINLNDNPDLAVINRAFPSNWRTNGTMAQLITDINNDTAAIKGRSYLATVSLSDLPSNLLQAEMLVYITDELAGQGKVIFFMITSNNTAPYHWEYTSAYGATGAWRSFALNDHTHGNITNDGKLQTTDINIASGDKLVVTDSSDNNKISRTSAAFDGTTTNKALTPKGTFEDFLQEDDIADLATKVENATSGNLAKLNSDGNITDSGISASNVLTVANKGVANGVASLDASGKVPSSQLPSYVDDVVELLTMASSAPATCATGDLYFNTTSGKIFTASGTNTWGSTGANPEKSKIYTDLSTNITYRWGGSTMVEISKGLEIGTTTGTAADGGVVNTHISNTSNPHNVTKAQIGLGNVDNKSSETIKNEVMEDLEEVLTEMEDVTAEALTDLDYRIKQQASKIEVAKAAINEAAKKAVETTWAELVVLRDSQQLIPGMWYRITDYECTTTQKNTRSAGHQFDIIVRADAVNVLNENAFAAKHSGDTYFTNAGVKFEAWELKYCIDNDSRRFLWAKTNGGKGVIYWMKDEWNNECPYDFKNIQFLRYKIDECLDVPQLEGQYAIGDAYKITVDDTVEYWCYTFCMIDTSDGSANDVTVKNGFYMSDEGFAYINHDNVIKPYITVYYGDNENYAVSHLNNTVMVTDTELCAIEEGYGEFYGFYCNVFGYNNYGNTIGNDFQCNTIGKYFSGNTIGYTFYYNTIGNNFQSNTIGKYFSGNTIGNNFIINTIGDGFQSNTIGNGCNNIRIQKDYVQYITIEDGNQYIDITSTQTTSDLSVLRNFTIAQGCYNTQARKTLSHNTVNDTFQTTYKPANSVEVSV